MTGTPVDERGVPEPTDVTAGLLSAGLPVPVSWLVVLATWGAVSAALHVWGRLRLRRTMLARLTAGKPHLVAGTTAMLQGAIPLWGRIGPAPARQLVDPFRLTTPTVVAPLGDGRPGERFDTPGPALVDIVAGPDGSRTDAQVVLGPGARFSAVFLGRVGAVRRGQGLRPAAERAARARTHPPAGWASQGPPQPVATAAGPGWRHTIATASAYVTDTHLDHDGWAFVVGVIARRSSPELADVVDLVLSTWQWIDDAGLPRHGAAPPDLPDEPGVAAVPLRLGGAAGRPAATVLAPAADSATDPRTALDGGRAEAFVRLTAIAGVTIVSAPGERTALARLEADALARMGESRIPTGPARREVTPAGEVWRRSFRLDGAVVEHIAELDHAGWAWTVRLHYAPGEGALASVLDDVLASWRWDEPSSDPDPATAADRP